MICTAEGLKMEIPCIRVGECSLEIFVISSVYSMGSISWRGKQVLFSEAIGNHQNCYAKGM